MAVKLILQLYPMMPAADEAEREALRPIGRNSDRYHEVIEGMGDIVRAADELGFWGMTWIEHHFHSEGYELNPSPGIMNAFYASQVKQLRMGQLGYVMGAQNPIRVAEETATIDHLTNGKYFVGFARGYQSRWTNILGQHYDARATVTEGGLGPDGEAQRIADDARNRRIFEDSIDLVLKAWTHDLVRHQSEFLQVPYPYETGVEHYPAAETSQRFGVPGEVGEQGEIRGVSVVPAPYQRPTPARLHQQQRQPGNRGLRRPARLQRGLLPGHRPVAGARRTLPRCRGERRPPLPARQAPGELPLVPPAYDPADYNDRVLKYDVEIFKNFISKFFPRTHFRPPATPTGWVRRSRTAACGSWATIWTHRSVPSSSSGSRCHPNT